MRSSILIFEHILEEEQEDRQEEGQEGVLRDGLWLLSKSELLQPATQKRKHRKQLSMIGEILDMDHGMHKMNEEDILSSDSSGGWHDEEEEDDDDDDDDAIEDSNNNNRNTTTKTTKNNSNITQKQRQQQRQQREERQLEQLQKKQDQEEMNAFLNMVKIAETDIATQLQKNNATDTRLQSMKDDETSPAMNTTAMNTTVIETIHETIKKQENMVGTHNVLLMELYQTYVVSKTTDGVALNGLGQMFHDLDIGNNSLTMCDLELIFHRNVQREEDEQYATTGKRRILRRLPYNGVVSAVIDFAKIKYRNDTTYVKSDAGAM